MAVELQLVQTVALVHAKQNVGHFRLMMKKSDMAQKALLIVIPVMTHSTVKISDVDGLVTS